MTIFLSCYCSNIYTPIHINKHTHTLTPTHTQSYIKIYKRYYAVALLRVPLRMLVKLHRSFRINLILSPANAVASTDDTIVHNQMDIKKGMG